MSLVLLSDAFIPRGRHDSASEGAEKNMMGYLNKINTNNRSQEKKTRTEQLTPSYFQSYPMSDQFCLEGMQLSDIHTYLSDTAKLSQGH